MLVWSFYDDIFFELRELTDSRDIGFGIEIIRMNSGMFEDFGKKDNMVRLLFKVQSRHSYTSYLGVGKPKPAFAPATMVASLPSSLS